MCLRRKTTIIKIMAEFFFLLKTKKIAVNFVRTLQYFGQFGILVKHFYILFRKKYEKYIYIYTLGKTIKNTKI